MELICNPTKEQWDALKKGDGKPTEELCKINSSAALAVNFWRAYDLCHPDASVEFEWKKRKPLQHGKPANIDVVVREADKITFIESKFLEPYYSENEKSSDSYYDASKYCECTKDSPESWISFFREANREAKKYNYYDVTQLGRHLLAISKDIWLTPQEYENKQIQLISVTWDMPDSFLALLKDGTKEEFKRRRTAIRKEAEESEPFINNFIKEHLGFDNLTYKAIKYNDIIDEIKESQFVEHIKEKYFL